MAAKPKPKWLTGSRAYARARELVDATIKSPQKLLQLVTNASALVTKNIGVLSELTASLKTALRMLRCYATGEYREVSLQSLGLLVASIIYLVMPVDVVPDFILALGYTDDAALLAWTLRSIMDDLERFSIWEANRDPHCTNF